MSTTTAPRVCLAMIVKDEAAIIERLLETVIPVVSSWRIIDTGSTDGTPEIITRMLASIPGELRHSEWADFATNRTELVEWASGTDDWLLLLDADMTLEVDDDFVERLAGFAADAAQVVVSGGVRYRMPYLVRSGLPWRYLGRTHEHLSCTAEFSAAWFDALRILHHADGSSHAEKMQRDILLLGADLEENPEHPRTLFYLAQTHRDLGEHERALELYERRIALGGWDEEVFWSIFQCGLLEDQLGRDEATITLERAWDFRPTRAEPAYELARINRRRRRHQIAWVWANVAYVIPMPSDSLFVNAWVYRWGSAFEFADAAWRVGNLTLAAERAREVLGHADVPTEHREHAELILRNTGALD